MNRALEADYAQVTMLLEALEHVKLRCDPLNPLRYVRADGLEAITIHMGDQFLAATIAAFRLAVADLAMKMGCFDESVSEHLHAEENEPLASEHLPAEEESVA